MRETLLGMGPTPKDLHTSVQRAFRGNGVAVAGRNRVRVAVALLKSGHLDLVENFEDFVIVKPHGAKLRTAKRKNASASKAR